MPDFQKQMVPYFSSFDDELRQLEYTRPDDFLQLSDVFMGLMDRIGVVWSIGSIEPWGDF